MNKSNIDIDKMRTLFSLSSIHHCSPTDDLKKHTGFCIEGSNGFPICECKCNPVYKFVDAFENTKGMLVIHNSYDGREGVEWANEILKQNGNV